MKLQTPLSLLAAAFTLALAAGPALAVESTRVVVTFKPGATAEAAARAAIAKAGGRIKLHIMGSDSYAVVLPTRAAEALKRHAAIKLVEPDAIRYLQSTSTPSGPPYKKGQRVPYGIKMVQADQLPQGDELTANRKVCIIDSGYDLEHEDLKGNDVNGEFDSGTGWWYTDELHHGTHVAGTIAAMNNKNKGVVGVAPNKKLKLHIVKVFDGNGDFAYSSTLANAARKCQAAGANIISMSLGGPIPSNAELNTFNALKTAGILSIAAAGNSGNQLPNYPASYAAVVSVAAIDENKAWAKFSQFNAQVELAGPGVSVLSTVPMGTGVAPELTVGTTVYAPNSMDGSPLGEVSAPLYNFGLGATTDAGAAGKVCLIQRGGTAFSDKVLNCQNSGGVGAVIYNNEAGAFLGTLAGVSTTIPSMTASDTEGTSMLAQIGQTAVASVAPSNYALFDGTSMATPHVSGVAALVWSYFPTCTGEQIRQTLNKSAQDLGPAGRDAKFGFGLVQAKAAYDRALALGCGL